MGSKARPFYKDKHAFEMLSNDTTKPVVALLFQNLFYPSSNMFSFFNPTGNLSQWVTCYKDYFCVGAKF